jgi:methenyltetrahydrofolate cyclohydrolase
VLLENVGPTTSSGRIGKNRGVPYTDMPFEELLDTIAAETPAPGGGSVAAFVTEMAASLAAMAARFAHDWDGAAGAVAQAETLRHRAAPLAGEDAVAYENVLTAMRMPEELESEVRNTLIGETLSRAADIPLLIAETANDVAELASEIAVAGNPNLRGDAAAASLLASAAARVAANLVVINLSTVEGEDRIERARALVRSSERAAQRAVGDSETS